MLSGGDPLLRIAEALHEESLRAGIPSIEFEDAIALYSLAYPVLAGRTGCLLIDAGAGLGYSTAWLVMAARDACHGAARVVAIEAYPPYASRLRDAARDIEEASGVKVEVWEGDALELVAEKLRGSTVDLAFVDIGKDGYTEMLRLLRTRLRPGGVAAFHNAYLPPPPPSFFRELSLLRRLGWHVTVVPTRLGIAVAVKPVESVLNAR